MLYQFSLLCCFTHVVSSRNLFPLTLLPQSLALFALSVHSSFFVRSLSSHSLSSHSLPSHSTLLPRSSLSLQFFSHSLSVHLLFSHSLTPHSLSSRFTSFGRYGPPHADPRYPGNHNYRVLEFAAGVMNEHTAVFECVNAANASFNLETVSAENLQLQARWTGAQLSDQGLYLDIAMPRSPIRVSQLRESRSRTAPSCKRQCFNRQPLSCR